MIVLTNAFGGNGYFLKTTTKGNLNIENNSNLVGERASLVAQLVKNLPAMWETRVRSGVGKIPWRQEKLPPPVFWREECHRPRG